MDLNSVATPDPQANSAKVITGPAPHARKMDRSLAHSLAWRAAANWTSQLFSWAAFLIILRLLTPTDFGIAAMAVTLQPFLRLISEFGIGQTLLSLRDLTVDQIAELNSVAALLGLGCFGLGALLSKPLALFFKTPALVPVVIVTCSSLVPAGFKAVSEGLLCKEMRFGLMAWLEAIFAAVSAVVTILLAYFGMGYWAFVLGNLAACIVRSVLVLCFRPHPFAVPHLAALRRPLLFGWHVLVSIIAFSAYERLDNVTAGRMLGKAALGFYGLAWNLAYVPLEKLTSLVTTVLPAYLAAVQKEPAALRRYLRTLTEALALATFPSTIGLALVARDLVPLAMGQKWQPVVAPLQILAVYATFRSVVALLPKVLTAVGKARFVMWNNLRALVILPVAFVMGSHWGITGIAWAWVVAYPLVALPLYWKTFNTIDMNAGEYIQALRPAVDGILIMTLSVAILKSTIFANLPMLPRLLLEIAAGAITYAATLLLLHRTRVMTFVRLAKSARQAKA